MGIRVCFKMVMCVLLSLGLSACSNDAASHSSSQDVLHAAFGKENPFYTYINGHKVSDTVAAGDMLRALASLDCEVQASEYAAAENSAAKEYIITAQSGKDPVDIHIHIGHSFIYYFVEGDYAACLISDRFATERFSQEWLMWLKEAETEAENVVEEHGEDESQRSDAVETDDAHGHE